MAEAPLFYSILFFLSQVIIIAFSFFSAEDVSGYPSSYYGISSMCFLFIRNSLLHLK